MKIEIIVGAGLYKDGKAILDEDIAEATDLGLTLMASQFGGSYVTSSRGAWIDPDTGKLISEPGMVFTSVIDDPRQGFPEEVIHQQAYDIGKDLRIKLNQKSVLVVVSPATMLEPSPTIVATPA